MHGWMDDHYVASGWGIVDIAEDTRPMTNHSNEAVSHQKIRNEICTQLVNMPATRGPRRSLMLYYCTEKIRLKDRAEKIAEYLIIYFFLFL